MAGVGSADEESACANAHSRHTNLLCVGTSASHSLTHAQSRKHARARTHARERARTQTRAHRRGLNAEHADDEVGHVGPPRIEPRPAQELSHLLPYHHAVLLSRRRTTPCPRRRWRSRRPAGQWRRQRLQRASWCGDGQGRSGTTVTVGANSLFPASPVSHGRGREPAGGETSSTGSLQGPQPAPCLCLGAEPAYGGAEGRGRARDLVGGSEVGDGVPWLQFHQLHDGQIVVAQALCLSIFNHFPYAENLPFYRW